MCQIAEVKEQAAALFRGLNNGITSSARPAPGRWSMGQWLAHIVITDEIYIPVLEKCMLTLVRRRRWAAGRFTIDEQSVLLTSPSFGYGFLFSPVWRSHSGWSGAFLGFQRSTISFSRVFVVLGHG